MLNWLARMIRPPSPVAVQMLATIASLHDSERIACEKGYFHAADRIGAIVADPEREYGSGCADIPVGGTR